MIIDAHAHITQETYGNIENYREAMTEAGIQASVIFPGGMLDVRKMTEYVTGRTRATISEPPNDLLREIVNEDPVTYSAFGVINPHGTVDEVVRDVERLHSFGFKGIKLSPMVYQFSLLGESTHALCARAGELNMPVYTHTLIHASANTAAVGKLAEQYPNTTFIIGHMGFGPLDVEAIALAKQFDNLYLETSLGNYLGLEQAVSVCGATKLIFGSEYPLSRPIIELKKIECLRISDDAKSLILGGNIAQILQLTVHA
ncbi:MAG: amidohydrolase family protein [Bacilli bacterium]